MATHSSNPAWGMPWTEGPGRLQSIGSQSDSHSLNSSFVTNLYTLQRRKQKVKANDLLKVTQSVL